MINVRKRPLILTHTHTPEAPASPDISIKQTGPTSIEARWIVPSTLVSESIYLLDYTGASTGQVTLTGSSADNFELDGLQNGMFFQMTIISLSSDPTEIYSSPTFSNVLRMGMYSILQFL